MNGEIAATFQSTRDNLERVEMTINAKLDKILNLLEKQPYMPTPQPPQLYHPPLTSPSQPPPVTQPLENPLINQLIEALPPQPILPQPPSLSSPPVPNMSPSLPPVNASFETRQQGNEDNSMGKFLALVFSYRM